MKYFQTSLGKLAKTLSADKKHTIQKLTVRLLTKHSHFSKVWKDYYPIKKIRLSKLLLEVKASFLMKGIIPYLIN